MRFLFLTTVSSIRRFIVMEKRYGALFIALLGGLVLILLAVRPVAAYYTSVYGELRDSKTGALWTHGAAVEVYNCFTLATIATDTVGVSGTFNIAIPGPPSPDEPLCIQVVFNIGPEGKPGNAVKGPYPNRAADGDQGQLNTGVYFTGTGPLAVTLASFGASGGGGMPVFLIAAVFLLVGGASLVAVRRRR
jgi:hypothetical protein